MNNQIQRRTFMGAAAAVLAGVIPGKSREAPEEAVSLDLASLADGPCATSAPIDLSELAVPASHSMYVTVEFSQPPTENVTFYLAPKHGGDDERFWALACVLMAGTRNCVFGIHPMPGDRLVWRTDNKAKIRFYEDNFVIE